MSVVFSLAEALNIAWGVWADEVHVSVRDRLNDAMWRRSAAGHVAQRHEGLVKASKAGWRKLIGHPDFLRFALTPDPDRANDELVQLVDEAFGDIDADLLARMAGELVSACTVAAERQSPALLRLVNARLEQMSDDQRRQIQLIREVSDHISVVQSQLDARSELVSARLRPHVDYVETPTREASGAHRVDVIVGFQNTRR
jgi:hypothetical protein